MQDVQSRSGYYRYIDIWGKFSLLLSSLPPPQLILSDPGSSFMTGEGGISTMLGLISLLLDFLRRLLDPNEMDQPFAWAFLCPLINWFVLAIKSFFRSKKSEDLRGGASMTMTWPTRIKPKMAGLSSKRMWSCVCLFVTILKSLLFAAAVDSFSYMDNLGQAISRAKSGKSTTVSRRRVVPCVRVYKWLLLLTDAYGSSKFLELENSQIFRWLYTTGNNRFFKF